MTELKGAERLAANMLAHARGWADDGPDFKRAADDIASWRTSGLSYHRSDYDDYVGTAKSFIADLLSPEAVERAWVSMAFDGLRHGGQEMTDDQEKTLILGIITAALGLTADEAREIGGGS